MTKMKTFKGILCVFATYLFIRASNVMFTFDNQMFHLGYILLVAVVVIPLLWVVLGRLATHLKGRITTLLGGMLGALLVGLFIWLSSVSLTFENQAFHILYIVMILVVVVPLSLLAGRKISESLKD